YISPIRLSSHFLFFFYASLHHRDLHSFPTRRSSDLAMYQVLALNIISFWVLRFPLTKIFAQVLGQFGIAIGMGTSFIVSSFIAFLYFRFGKWRQKELFRER